MRVMRYFSQHHATTRFCGWTGSLTDKSVTDFAHLAFLALREGSPVPLNGEVAQEWGRCLDATENPCPPGALLRLCEPGENVRAAFRRRLAETPGFIATTSSAVVIESDAGPVEVGLDVRERVPPPLPPVVEEALAIVRARARPDMMAGSRANWELDDPLAQAKCAQEVACGMFYRWIFPRGEPTELIDEWYAARKAYSKEVRQKLMRGEEYLDSPNLLEHAARRAWGDSPKRDDRPEWRADGWPHWRDVRDLVEPKTQAVRLHPYLVEDAAEWGRSNRGIIWYGMVEFATWVAQLSGLTVHGEVRGRPATPPGVRGAVDHRVDQEPRARARRAPDDLRPPARGQHAVVGLPVAAAPRQAPQAPPEGARGPHRGLHPHARAAEQLRAGDDPR